jgi:hypothetical protein
MNTHSNQNNNRRMQGAIRDAYTTTTACKFLGISYEELNRMVESREILRLRDDKGNARYPSFQFSSTGETAPHVQKIIQTLLEQGFTERQAALWLTTESSLCDGKSPVEFMQADPKRFGIVLYTAQHDTPTP